MGAAPTPDMGRRIAATDIKRLVRMIGAANQLADIPMPRKAWLPELRRPYDIARAAQLAGATTS